MFLMTASLNFYQGGGGGGGGGLVGFVPIILIFAIMYFLLIRPQQKEQKKHQLLIDNLQKGDKIITKGGIWGEIDTVDVQFVRLKVNEKAKIVVSRSAVAQKQPVKSSGDADSGGKQGKE